MTCAVNLLPESCRNARHRAVRRTVWTVATTTAGALVVCAWVVGQATDQALARRQAELKTVQSRQSELDHQLMLATITRNDLARQARALLSLRQEQVFPQQLLDLSSRAPEGIVLTEISAEARRRTQRSPSHRAPPSGPSEDSTQHGQVRLARLIHLSGFAVEHSQLTRLIDVLQSAEHGQRWGEVELLRAAREPFGGRPALAFQLECRRAEGLP